MLLLSDGLEDPLDDLGMVQQQLEQLAVIERCEYEKTCALLVQLFDQVFFRHIVICLVSSNNRGKFLLLNRLQVPIKNY